MATQKRASELKDLDVDRVDGVDKPATGRNFLLFKSEDGAAIMKGYGAVATAAHIVLQKMRTDKNATVSRKSAIALNGLAQILGEDAVFVGKSVPTQPYEYSEPDVDSRGPADEDLGGNFTPRSMPGSMVGSVSFRMKDEDEDEDDSKAKSKAKAMYDEDEDDRKAKAKAKAKAAAKAAKDASMDDDEDEDEDDKKAKAADARLSKMESAIEKLAETVAKAIAGPVQKSEDVDDEPQPVRKARSRQIDADEPVSVRKGAGIESRFNVGFGDVVFGK